MNKIHRNVGVDAHGQVHRGLGGDGIVDGVEDGVRGVREAGRDVEHLRGSCLWNALVFGHSNT